MDELKAILREVMSDLRTQRREIAEIESSVTAIAKSLEDEDRRQERRERDEERDREKLTEAVDALTQRVENIGVSMRDFPDRMLQHIEKKVYELRTARWEALQAGVQREMTPPYGTPMPPQYREQTGKIAVAAPDDFSLTPAQQRGLAKLAKRVWEVGRWPALAAGAGGGAVALFHKIMHMLGH